MATPKRKTSHSRTAQRKAQWLGALSAPEFQSCPRCGEKVQAYRACAACGYYRGRKVLTVGEEEAAN
ncbi:50S ribosomal protein L32 [Fretibacterium fastidiosum]|jgi:ribosomal protein L32|uniref:Large ribosomal subunit protein bL32 n=1 Tax=Fretibacterium fastidiosum TaxID=651822 RepID=A0AB94IX96_9BACT|nr:50S ribosomal protein L32 [Fretibacterium fastidiosum]CBL28423.1 LSU ribosomal protein L32P [Fretibacterium fastidiosum]